MDTFLWPTLYNTSCMRFMSSVKYFSFLITLLKQQRVSKIGTLFCCPQIARLYLVSDILHNCTVKVSNASNYRKGWEYNACQGLCIQCVTLCRKGREYNTCSGLCNPSTLFRKRVEESLQCITLCIKRVKEPLQYVTLCRKDDLWKAIPEHLILCLFQMWFLLLLNWCNLKPIRGTCFFFSFWLTLMAKVV